MKKLIPLFFICLCACNEQTEKKITTAQNIDSTKSIEADKQFETCWSGMINNKIPVFVHYSFHDSIIVGEIIYLNTKNKKPITLIGKIDEDRKYRLMEFEKNGNISGIISGTPSNNAFTGSWYSPATEKEFSLNLSAKDTSIESADQQLNPGNIYGHYFYQFSEEGYQGGLDISKLNDTKAIFSISSVTGAPSRNVADVPEDTVEITGNHFNYKFPDSEECDFKVTFYNGFLIIEYTNGICNDQFGMNATVEGIYLKVAK